jgi:hypothetical protein
LKVGGYSATTRWTVVVSAGRKSSPRSDRALGELCQSYWYPLYAYVRRQGHTKERVITRLRDESAAAGKTPLFERAKGCLMVGESAIPHSQAAKELQMDEGAVRVAVHRMRKRYRELLREEIAQTLSDPAQLAEELRSLQAALAT